MKALGVWIIALWAFSASANANVTFNYVGNNFVLGPGGVEPINPAFGLRIVATAIFDDSLSPTFTGTLITGSSPIKELVTFTMSSGPITLSWGAAGVHEAFPLQFDFVDGVIDSWNLGLQSDDLFTFLHTVYLGCPCGISGQFASNHLDPVENGNSGGDPSVWVKASPIPLPPSGSLLGVALVTIASRRAARRRIGKLRAAFRDI